MYENVILSGEKHSEPKLKCLLLFQNCFHFPFYITGMTGVFVKALQPDCHSGCSFGSLGGRPVPTKPLFEHAGSGKGLWAVLGVSQLELSLNAEALWEITAVSVLR